MAKNETKQLAPAVLIEDREIYAAIKDISDYRPANPAYSQAALDTSHDEMVAAQQEEAQAAARLATARDNKVAAEWAFHNKLLGGKVQVEAQFGSNSNELQSLKLKKKTEYKSPTRGSKKGGSSNK